MIELVLKFGPAVLVDSGRWNHPLTLGEVADLEGLGYYLLSHPGATQCAQSVRV